MPIYEFKCQECGKTFESLCFQSDKKDIISCPSCGGKKVEKLLSTFSYSGSGQGIGTASASSSCASTNGFS
ncbi:MAG: zinc ribbon domain-containing protein [Deltaproteobacteria bacterium]|nr:zinc ribbon domain-containing protein [Deltaproteobacteria bacterium]